jgi:1,4-dihydroxy-2-naphthoate octaprenyltransferase
VSRFVTLSKKDSEFQSYLLGTFSETERALPIQSLNVNTLNEQVTFKIVPISSLAMPTFMQKWLTILRVHTLTLVLLPIFLVLVKNLADAERFNYVVALCSCVGVALLHCAVNLRNDFYDHLSGIDRVNPERGSRAIQQGWITASQVKKLSWFIMILSLVAGLPALVNEPRLILLVALSAIGVFWGYSASPSGFKYPRWNEFGAFILLGPLLTVGFEMSGKRDFDFETVFLGSLCGWLTVFLIHLKNFESILVQSQAELRNTINWLGFDKAKKMLLLWWLTFIFLFSSYHSLYSGKFWTVVSTLFVSIASIPFMIRLSSMESPIGSQITLLIRRGRFLYFTTLSIWLIENIWVWIDHNANLR